MLRCIEFQAQCQGFLSMMDWIPEPCIKINVSSFPFLYFVVIIAVVVLSCQVFDCNETKKELTTFDCKDI